MAINQELLWGEQGHHLDEDNHAFESFRCPYENCPDHGKENSSDILEERVVGVTIPPFNSGNEGRKSKEYAEIYACPECGRRYWMHGHEDFVPSPR